jgi:two-component system sensor kinase FixL
MSERPAASRLALIALVVAAGYYAGVQIGLALTFRPATTSVLWPPNAILTAALLMVPPRIWWVCLAAALPVHILLELQSGFSAGLTALLFVTNCSEALLAAVAVRALSGGSTGFDSFRRVAAFIGGAGLLAPIVSSFADAAVVNQLRGEPYWDVWRVRVFANALTELSVAPAIILGWQAIQSLRARRPPVRWVIEWFAFVAVLLALAVLVFGRPGVRDALPGSPPTPIVLLLPVFGWAAMRFGVGGVSAALLGSAMVASYETAAGLRPFASLRPADSLIAVQMILAVVAMPLMLLAGLLGDRRQALEKLAARLRFEKLLSSVAGSFLRLTDDEAALTNALTRVSEFFDADCVSVLQLSDGDIELGAQSERCEPNVAGLTVQALRERSPSAIARALNGETVVLTSDDMSPSAAPQAGRSDAPGFRFLAILPFAGSDVVRGAMLLATTRERLVSESDLAQLRLIADVIATARGRRRAELDAQRSRQEVAQMARRSSMGELASALAHQLNQPLAAIMANAQASQRLLRSSTPPVSELSEGLDDIVQDCRRASDVVRRVRDMVAPSRVQRAPLDLTDVVREVGMLLASDTLIRRVRLTFEFDGDRALIYGDRVLLQQAVLNVIVNAIDAVADLRESDRVVTVWTGSAGDNHLRVRVRDRGKGLPPGLETQVFEPFFSTKSTGLGMGLAIARSIVESHGGTIQLESDPAGGGVVVTIMLPVAELAA